MRLPAWYSLASQGVLMQAWAPWLTEQTVQLHCWCHSTIEPCTRRAATMQWRLQPYATEAVTRCRFLSAMVPYWLLYGLFFRKLVLRLRSLRATGLTLALLALPPWFQFLFPAVLEGEGYGEWYSSHRTGSLASWRSVSK